MSKLGILCILELTNSFWTIKKIRFFSKILKFFLCPSPVNNFFFKFFFQKKVVHYTFYMILSRFEQNFFFRIFARKKIFDFGSPWRPYRTSVWQIFWDLVLLSTDEHPHHVQWSVDYYCPRYESPKTTYIVKNAILAILGHFWAWPLCATFWILIFKLS